MACCSGLNRSEILTGVIIQLLSTLERKGLSKSKATMPRCFSERLLYSVPTSVSEELPFRGALAGIARSVESGARFGAKAATASPRPPVTVAFRNSLRLPESQSGHKEIGEFLSMVPSFRSSIRQEQPSHLN